MHNSRFMLSYRKYLVYTCIICALACKPMIDCTNDLFISTVLIFIIIQKTCIGRWSEDPDIF